MRTANRTLLGACALALATSAMGAEMIPLEEFFPVGVYVGGSGPVATMGAQGASVEEQIEAACADLKAHHFNCAWLSNASPKHLDAWFASGEKHGVRVIPQGGGMPMYLLCAGWWKDRWEPAIEKQVKPFYRE
ncbi:MAG: hypothetical protein FJ278_15200, partial [Planctomycetes bacterium]|nr:hypothetical protein [Planctomycetota bacterium]